MKIEPRGKYAGVKVHLDAEEVNTLLSCMSGDEVELQRLPLFVGLAGKMARKTRALMEEDPTLLTDRTPAQIAAALEKEEVSARLKKEVLAKGQDWKKVKVKVEVEE